VIPSERPARLSPRLSSILVGVLFLFPSFLFAANAPVQPIAFSHRIHTGEYKIPCQYCHVYTDRSPVAGVPSVRLCMGCHQITAAQKPEIVKLKGYWDRGEPVPWIRVHILPGYVHFSHQPHILRGLICQECHGPVQTMVRLRQVAPLTMRWCVDCHEKNGADRDCLVCHH
jgi:hypothetical protein